MRERPAVISILFVVDSMTRRTGSSRCREWAMPPPDARQRGPGGRNDMPIPNGIGCISMFSVRVSRIAVTQVKSRSCSSPTRSFSLPSLSLPLPLPLLPPSLHLSHTRTHTSFSLPLSLLHISRPQSIPPVTAIPSLRLYQFRHLPSFPPTLLVRACVYACMRACARTSLEMRTIAGMKASMPTAGAMIASPSM